MSTFIDAAAPSRSGVQRGSNTVSGTQQSETIAMGAGMMATGAGGDDTFRLQPGDEKIGTQFLGVVLDFNEGDKLDLSGLGLNAQVLQQTKLANGQTRASIDYDGDGKENGFVILGAPPHWDDQPPHWDAQPMPMPDPNAEVRIQPVFDMPVAGSGSVVGAPVEKHPIPRPDPNAEVTILPIFDEDDAGEQSLDGEVHILPWYGDDAEGYGSSILYAQSSDMLVSGPSDYGQRAFDGLTLWIA